MVGIAGVKLPKYAGKASTLAQVSNMLVLSSEGLSVDKNRREGRGIFSGLSVRYAVSLTRLGWP
ncbi:hypothetical protein, partial [Vibrio cholerae]|uniref:hypothetical protein n=1 Tax=Vibrio cholerae TaxID=666 RepID=UPI001F285214